MDEPPGFGLREFDVVLWRAGRGRGRHSDLYRVVLRPRQDHRQLALRCLRPRAMPTWRNWPGLGNIGRGVAMQPVAAMEHQAAVGGEPGACSGGDERAVIVARANIPPAAAQHLDVGRLQRLGGDEAPTGDEEGGHVVEAGGGETVRSITSKQVISLNFPCSRAGRGLGITLATEMASGAPIGQVLAS
jgi:hypothetical protein